MFKKALLAVAAVATLTFASITPASAIGLGSFSRNGPASEFASRPAPLAYQLFCLKYRNECKVGGGRSTVAYTPRIRKLLNSVNRSVNGSIIARNDSGDSWSLNPRFGDCEDFALTKRSRLIRAGVPAAALRIAVVRTRSGEGHAVLFVRTSAGEMVLDSIRKNIVARNQMSYRLVMEASADPTRFVRF